MDLDARLSTRNAARDQLQSSTDRPVSGLNIACGGSNDESSITVLLPMTNTHNSPRIHAAFYIAYVETSTIPSCGPRADSRARAWMILSSFVILFNKWILDRAAYRTLLGLSDRLSTAKGSFSGSINISPSHHRNHHDPDPWLH